MNARTSTPQINPVGDEAIESPADNSFIPISDPDVTLAEIEAVEAVMRSQRLSGGAEVKAFEAAFAAYLGRRYAIAVPSGTLGLLIALRAYGIAPGDEVIASPYSFRETTHAISIVGARPVFADIDYWTGTLPPKKSKPKSLRVRARSSRATTMGIPRNGTGCAPSPKSTPSF